MNENPGGNPEEMEVVSPSREVDGGFWASLIDIFIDPVKVFKRIKNGLPWWQPFLVIAVASAAIAWFQGPINRHVLLLNERGLPEDQLQRQVEIMDKFGFIGLIVAPVAVLIIYLAIAGLCNVTVNLVSGRSGFKKMMSLISFTGIIGIIEQALKLLIFHMKGIENITSKEDLYSVSFSLTRFIDADGFLRALLDSLSIFGIWFLVLFVIGVSVVYGTSKKAALAPAGVMWLLGILLSMLQGVGG